MATLYRTYIGETEEKYRYFLLSTEKVYVSEPLTTKRHTQVRFIRTEDEGIFLRKEITDSLYTEKQLGLTWKQSLVRAANVTLDPSVPHDRMTLDRMLEEHKIEVQNLP